MADVHKALLVAGSPSRSSRSTWVLESFGEHLRSRGVEVARVSLEDFDAEALLRGKTEHPSVNAFLAKVRDSTALVLSTPVYKSTYAGSLKTIVDLIDPAGLEGKRLLGIATARLEFHLQTVSESFLQLSRFFRGCIALPSIALLDAQIGQPGAFKLDAVAEAALDDAVRAIVSRQAAFDATDVRRA